MKVDTVLTNNFTKGVSKSNFGLFDQSKFSPEEKNTSRAKNIYSFSSRGKDSCNLFFTYSNTINVVELAGSTLIKSILKPE